MIEVFCEIITGSSGILKDTRYQEKSYLCFSKNGRIIIAVQKNDQRGEKYGKSDDTGGTVP